MRHGLFAPHPLRAFRDDGFGRISVRSMGPLRAASSRATAARNAVVVLTSLALAAVAVVTLAGGTAGASSQLASATGPNCTPSGGGNVCVLDPSATDAFSITGQSSLTLARNLVVNSTAAEAAVASDGSTVAGAAIGGPAAPGGFATTGSGSSFSPTPFNVAAQPDPYAGSSVSHGSCSGGTSLTVTSGSQSASPDTYSTLGAGGSGTLHLNPGVYTITGAFNNASGGTINGTDVTLYFCSGADF